MFLKLYFYYTKTLNISFKNHSVGTLFYRLKRVFNIIPKSCGVEFYLLKITFL